MPESKEVELLIEMIKTSGTYPFPPSKSESEARSRFHDFFMKLTSQPSEFEKLERVTDFVINGSGASLRTRIYTPRGKGPFPIVMHFHGGGWTRGDLDIWDGFCAQVSSKSSCIVASVDYRLAPEHRFPAALNDAYDSTLWASRNARSFGGDPERLAVVGDSAGGNLAAAVCLLARDRKRPRISLQGLIYPALNYSFDTKSYLDFRDSFFLTREKSVANWNSYLGSPDNSKNPYACPLVAQSLRDLPRATVITAECDPLRDEGESYARRLQNDGVRVDYRCYPGMIHPFVLLSLNLSEGKKAIDDLATDIRDAMPA